VDAFLADSGGGKALAGVECALTKEDLVGARSLEVGGGAGAVSAASLGAAAAAAAATGLLVVDLG